MRRTATFDRTRRYRYTLGRRWGRPGGPACCFVLLNPSTADATRDDPTIRRCIRFAQAWGYDGAEIVNIFALRSTDPSVLADAADPVGPGNDRAIARAAARCDSVVLGWGAHGKLLGRDAAVLRLLARPSVNARPLCLGTTACGRPKHPLYLRSATRRVPLPVPAGAH